MCVVMGGAQVPSGGAMPGVTSAPGSGSGNNSLSFLSSVMRSTGHTNPGKIISKKLWRQRSKSQSRATPQVSSPWTPPSDIKVSQRVARGHNMIYDFTYFSVLDTLL